MAQLGDTKVTNLEVLNGVTATTLNGVTIGTSPKFTDTNTTYTIKGGTNKITVTPSSGSAYDVTVTPSITNNVTGSGTSGYLTKFNGVNTITNGPQLGSSTTTFLRNDGTWATPSGSVTGVKGNSESSYRTGQVNITAANIGLGNVNNTSDANKPISTATQTALDNKANKQQAIYFVKGTQTATTAAWTGAIEAAALFDGMTIAYYLPRKSASNVTLNLTLSGGGTTGAKEVYVSGITRLGTHYAAGSTVYLTYYSAGSISIDGAATTTDRWTANDYWNSNTYDRTYMTGASIKAKTAITASNLIVAGSDGYYFNLNSGTAFDTTYPLLYANAAIAANANSNSDVYFCIPFTVTSTQSITLTTQKPVFIKGTLSGTMFTPVSKTPLIQTVPTSADNYQYMFVGFAYSATTIHLAMEHPIFEYSNGSWHRCVGNLKALAYKASASATYAPAGTVSKPTFSGTAATLSHTVTQGTVSASGKFTPAGTISVGTGTANYTPAGTVSTPTITVTANTTSVGSASGWSAGSVPTLGTAIAADDITEWKAGTAASASVSAGVLTITNGTAPSLSYTARSIPNVTSVGTAPSLTVTSTTVATGIKSATSSQPTFTGTGKELKFTGTEGTVSVSGSTSGVAVAAHSYTPAGGVSQPTFSGTQATITVS